MQDIVKRYEVEEFAKHMEMTLLKHDHKDHWSSMTPSQLLDKLTTEVVELRSALVNATSTEGLDRVADEAVDVANFAMFIWDKVRVAKQCQVTA